MSAFTSGDTLTPSTLNRILASAVTPGGFSTNTLVPESGSRISVSGRLRMAFLELMGPANAAGGRDVVWLDSSAATRRWVVRTDTGAESGGDAGSPFELTAVGDTGSTDPVLQIGRPSTSAISSTRPLALPSGTALAPAQTWTSEVSLGLYRSGNSVMALSYGRVAIPNNPPASGTASGTTGEVSWGAISGTTYLFVCQSTNSWLRVAASPF